EEVGRPPAEGGHHPAAQRDTAVSVRRRPGGDGPVRQRRQATPPRPDGARLPGLGARLVAVAVDLRPTGSTRRLPMTIRSWLRNLLSRKTANHLGHSRTSPRKRAVRKVPALEVLEDRTLLTGTPTATLQLLPAPGQSTPAAVTLLLSSFQLGFH